MATTYLGPEFDIHGGGLDLVFPHHENEQAQSHAAGDPFARYWLHNAWVTMGGEKMSKSLGNTLSDRGAAASGSAALELRYYLVGPHYRSSIEYSDGRAGRGGVGVPADRVVRAPGPGARTASRSRRPTSPPSSPRPWTTTSARPGALAAVHGLVREGNTALDAGDAAAALARGLVRAGDDRRARPRPARRRTRRPAAPRTPRASALGALVESTCWSSGSEPARERDFAAADGLRDDCWPPA